jgi:hypothetical protein
LGGRGGAWKAQQRREERAKAELPWLWRSPELSFLLPAEMRREKEDEEDDEDDEEDEEDDEEDEEENNDLFINEMPPNFNKIIGKKTKRIKAQRKKAKEGIIPKNKCPPKIIN